MAQTPQSPQTRELFTHMLREAGMPVTTKDMQQQWDSINTAQGSRITNNSAWSPFWRLISAIVTAPAQWLVNLLVEYALPNTFLRFSGGVWLDVFAWGVDVQRKQATPARGVLTFMRENSTGALTIPEGFAVFTPDIDGSVYTVFTLAEATIAEGALSVEVPVQAEQSGEGYNLGPGYYSVLSVPIAGLRVSNGPHWLTQAGSDTENDEALRLRTRNQFAAVGQYHHDAAYKALIAAAFPAIRIDHLFFVKDGPRGPGTANCYLMLESGLPPDTLVAEVNAYIRESGNHGHGDDLVCMSIIPRPVRLVATVFAHSTVSALQAEQVRGDVENRIRAAFRENTDYTVTKTLPLSRFSFSRLSEELHQQLSALLSVTFAWVDADGPDEVDEAHEAGSTDIVSYFQLPVLDTLTVNLADGAAAHE